MEVNIITLFNLGKNKEKENKKPVYACNGGCSTSKNDRIENDYCNATRDDICCIKVLGSGYESCHALLESTREAVKAMGLSIEVEYVTDMQKIMEYGVVSMPALVINEKAASMREVLKSGDAEKLLYKLGF